MEADQQDTASTEGAIERPSWSARCPARLNDDIESLAIAVLKQQLSKIAAGRVDDVSRPKGRSGRQTLVIDVDGYDTSAAIATRGASDEKRADTTRADHSQSLIWALRHSGQGVEGHRKRLSHSCRIVIAAPGDVATDGGRRHDELCEPAVDLQAERPVFGAKIRAAVATPAAVTT
jgi:hypothetical protein